MNWASVHLHQRTDSTMATIDKQAILAKTVEVQCQQISIITLGGEQAGDAPIKTMVIMMEAAMVISRIT